MAGGLVPQAELFQDRQVLDERCQLCYGARGSRHHRLFCCDAYASFRQSLGYDSLLRSWARGKPDDPFLARCLAPSVVVYTPRLRGVSPWRWLIPPRHGWISGKVCVDGSALDPEVRLFTRAAWALVVVDDAGTVVASASGPLEHGIHTIYGAEVLQF